VDHEHSPLGQDEFDIPQVQAEDMIQPDRVTDHPGREALSAVGGRLGCHLVSLDLLLSRLHHLASSPVKNSAFSVDG
jgi:hypothetical protein